MNDGTFFFFNYSRYTMLHQWLDIYITCKVITPLKLVLVLYTELLQYYIFPMQYSTSPWLSGNDQFVPFNFLPPLPISLTLPSHPTTIKMLSVPMNLLFCLFNSLDSTCNWNHIFVLLCLTYSIQHSTLSVHPCCHRWQYFIIFYG